MTKTNEEKILDILAGMSKRMDSMESGLNIRMDSMEARMDSMESGLNTRMDSMEARMNSMENGLSTRIDSIENEVLKINFRIETDIISRLDALAEGHSAILEQLVPTSRVDELENRVKMLEAVLSSVTSELTALRKAQ